MPRYRISIILLTYLALSVGCGAESGRSPALPSKAASVTYGGGATNAVSTEGRESGASPEASQIQDRKIVFSADVELVVDDFAAAEKEIGEMVETAGGFVAGANFQSLQGTRRYGTMNAKIPSQKFESFLDSIGSVGVVVTKKQRAQDMTEEFVDLSARNENKKKLEQRILGLIERSNDSLDQVLKLENELSRVREEIERMEGKIRLIGEQTTFSSVDIQLREEQEYTPAATLAFSVRIQNAWNESLKAMREGLEETAIFLVSNLFGILLAILATCVGWIAFKRIKPRDLRSEVVEPLQSHES